MDQYKYGKPEKLTKDEVEDKAAAERRVKLMARAKWSARRAHNQAVALERRLALMKKGPQYENDTTSDEEAIVRVCETPRKRKIRAPFTDPVTESSSEEHERQEATKAKKKRNLTHSDKAG